jgi:hypothetical protein
VFAGAAREVVFANPDIVRRINAEFIPVALKAALVNNPPTGVEGELYAELNRTKAAPQGICVSNSAGKPLAWALSFDSESSIGKFLDYAQQRFKDAQDPARPVTTERFMKFPGHKLADIAGSGRERTVPSGHPANERCPALPAREPGTLVGRIIGRPLDENGLPIDRTLRQEDYLEARFEISSQLQRRLSRAAAAAGDESFTVPAEVARAIVSHAYLGQLDVSPLGGIPIGGRTDSESIQFRARNIAGDKATRMLRVTGESVVSGGPAQSAIRTDGRQWEHRVQLTWEGYIELTDDRVTQLVMMAEGMERLRWGNRALLLTIEPDVEHLMAGHPIDLDCRVRYGLTAAPSVR